MGRDLVAALARRLPLATTVAGPASWYGVATAVSHGSRVVSAVLLARAFSTADFTAYSYFGLTAAMVASYSSLGLGVVTSRLAAEAGPRRPWPAGTLALVSMCGALAGAAVLLLLPEPWVTAGLDVPRWLLAASAILIALQTVPEGAALGLERYREVAAVSLLHGAGLLGSAALAVRHDLPLLAMAGIAAGAVLNVAGHGGVVARATGWSSLRRGAVIRMSDVAGVARVLGPMYATNLLAVSSAWLVGRLILVAGDQAFALYAIGYSWFGLGLWLPNVMGRIVLARLAQMLRNSRAAARELLRQTLVAAGLATCAIGGAVLAVGPFLSSLYGANYAVNRWIVAAYFGAALVRAPAGLLGSAIIADDGQREWLRCHMTHAVVLLAATAAALGGGAWAGVTGYSASGICLVLLGYRACRRRRLI